MSLGPDFASVDANGNPDLVQARTVGHMSFAILRAMENTSPDSDYLQYAKLCHDHGVPYSPYLFIHFGDGAKPPETQANACLDFIEGTYDPVGFIPTIDVEFPVGRAKTGLSAPEALSWVRRAWSVFKNRLHFAPMIYTSAVVWADPDGMAGLAAPDLAESPLWVKYWPYPERSAAVYDLTTVGNLPNPHVPT